MFLYFSYSRKNLDNLFLLASYQWVLHIVVVVLLPVELYMSLFTSSSLHAFIFSFADIVSIYIHIAEIVLLSSSDAALVVPSMSFKVSKIGFVHRTASFMVAHLLTDEAFQLIPSHPFPSSHANLPALQSSLSNCFLPDFIEGIKFIL